MTFVGQQITHMESRRGCNADRVSNIISKHCKCCTDLHKALQICCTGTPNVVHLLHSCCKSMQISCTGGANAANLLHRHCKCYDLLHRRCKCCKIHAQALQTRCTSAEHDPKVKKTLKCAHSSV